MATAAGQVECVDRAAVQRWLPQLDEWLLPGQFYGVQHTWPQLYRSDGGGMFFVSTDGDRLISHCACRLVTVHGEGSARRVTLLGSVVTDPARRGEGHAGAVLAAAVAACESHCDAMLLWAERPELYSRHGFAEGNEEACFVLARRPRREATGVVRLAEVTDHAALHVLHGQKPLRVERSASVMSGLLTTPGMTTVVLEENGVVVAYACCGKGSDLQGYWHELGGSDAAVAQLLPAAMHLVDQLDAVVLVPPYRAELRALLGASVTNECVVAGPKIRSRVAASRSFWIDGLDSV